MHAHTHTQQSHAFIWHSRPTSNMNIYDTQFDTHLDVFLVAATAAVVAAVVAAVAASVGAFGCVYLAHSPLRILLV